MLFKSQDPTFCEIQNASSERFSEESELVGRGAEAGCQLGVDQLPEVAEFCRDLHPALQSGRVSGDVRRPGRICRPRAGQGTDTVSKLEILTFQLSRPHSA